MVRQSKHVSMVFLLVKPLMLGGGALTLMTSSNLITFQRPHLHIPLTHDLAIKFPAHGLWEDTFSS